MKHYAKSSKDRTGLFSDKPEFIITAGVGKRINEWCNNGTDLNEVKNKIKACSTNEALNKLYHKYAVWKNVLNTDFIHQQEKINKNHMSNLNNISNDGTTNSQLSQTRTPSSC